MGVSGMSLGRDDQEDQVKSRCTTMRQWYFFRTSRTRGESAKAKALGASDQTYDMVCVHDSALHEKMDAHP